MDEAVLKELQKINASIRAGVYFITAVLFVLHLLA